MICTVLQNRDIDALFEALDECRMAEVRLDRCDIGEDAVDELFSSADIPLVATCRISEMAAKHPEKSSVAVAQICEKRLIAAIKAGAAYVDLEIEAPKEMLKRIKSACEDNGTLLIRSFHDFSGTDSVEALKAVAEKCVYHGADIVKIVTTANSDEDAARLLSLYDDPSFLAPPQSGRQAAEAETAEGRLIAFCMGEKGTESRMECLRRGAPFTYAALNAAETAAPGQRTADEMAEELYGSLPVFDADIIVPASKSFAQRAVIAAALADGTSRLRNYTACEDSEAAIRAAEALGAKVIREKAGDRVNLVITGTAASEGSLPQLRSVNAGESGLLARLLLPLAAELSDGETAVTVDGEKTLKTRRLAGLTGIMSEMGVGLSSPDEKLPVSVKGHIKNLKAEISGENGSQLLSGLLMALPLTGKSANLLVENPKSIPYSFMTAEVLKKFGIKISNEMLGGRDFMESDGDWSLCTEMIFKIRGGQKYVAADIDLEGDWSSAVPFMVAASIFGKACVDGLNTVSVQADIAVMDILMASGASISQLDGDEGEIHIHQSPLLAFEADASHCPDIFPCISVLAAFCQGRSRIYGVSRLRDKESDRAAAIVEMLGKMGVEAGIDTQSDSLCVTGHSLSWRILNGKLLKGGKFTSGHDHRMVMALKLASLGADSPVEIDDTACVAKSYPDFNAIFDESVNA